MSGQNPLLPDAPSCKFCNYCKPIIDPMNIGRKQYQCRRYPPQAIPIAGPGGAMAIAGIWPSISGNDVCGEFDFDDSGPFSDGLADLDAQGGDGPKLIIG